MAHPIGDLTESTMKKIREMIDVNTIVGNPIITGDGITLIPISKVAFGFGIGGSDFGNKNQAQNAPVMFGGGGGAGVNISPVAFIVVSNGNVRLLPISPPASTTVDRIVELVPEMIDKITHFMEDKKADEGTEYFTAGAE